MMHTLSHPMHNRFLDLLSHNNQIAFLTCWATITEVFRGKLSCKGMGQGNAQWTFLSGVIGLCERSSCFMGVGS